MNAGIWVAGALLVALVTTLHAQAQAYCDSRGCPSDPLDDLRVMLDFATRAGIPIKQTNCKPGVLGLFSSVPATTGTLTVCNAALARGVSGVRETFQHEMIHAAQFCRARNNGAKGFWTLSNNRESILNKSRQTGKFRHVGGSYGPLIEHEAYTFENFRPRDALYLFNQFCLEGKK